MTMRRERHGRGLRGPVASHSPFLGGVVPMRRRPRGADVFIETVSDAIARVGKHCPDALTGVQIGVEEVPHLRTNWTEDRVPLAAAVEASPDRPAQVVVYRRPLEHRAVSRRGLRVLVFRTIVEQLAVVKNLTVEQIDPTGYASSDDDEWDD